MNFKDNYRINWPNEILKPWWRVTEMEDWSEKTADSPIEIKWREITATLESSRSYINLTQIYFISISSLKCIFTYDIYESDFKISLNFVIFILINCWKCPLISEIKPQNLLLNSLKGLAGDVDWQLILDSNWLRSRPLV